MATGMTNARQGVIFSQEGNVEVPRTKHRIEGGVHATKRRRDAKATRGQEINAETR